jgi:hypothetical protein
MNDDDYVDYGSLEKPKRKFFDRFKKKTNAAQPAQRFFSRFHMQPKKEVRRVKAYILFFKTENDAELVKQKIEDGNITIKDKTFDVDGFRPKLLRTSFGSFPLYLLKWDCMNPPTEVNPVFKQDKDVTPEIYNKTMKMKILGNMLKIKGGGIGNWMYAAIGVAFGIFMAYYLITMKVIPI